MLRIAINFDGTIVEHTFPNIGNPVPGAIEWMRKWQEAGAILILWTTRSDGQQSEDVLTQAVDYCRTNGIEFDGINEGPNDRDWTTSPKAHAHIYVDDAAFGCPLRRINNGRSMVDWSIVGPAIMGMVGLYNTH